MTTSIIIAIIALTVFVGFSIHIRIKILKNRSDKFFLIKYLHDINQILYQIKNADDPKTKRMHILNLTVHLFLLLFIITLIILLLFNPDVV